jgi:HlyD family secretion protein
MKSWVKQGSFVAVPLLALTALYATARPPAEEAEAAFESEAVERRSLEVTAEAAGLIEPIRLVEVKSKASGEILRLTVESGDAVARRPAGRGRPARRPQRVGAGAGRSRGRRGAHDHGRGAARAFQELRAANVITEQEFESAKLEEANARAQYVKAQVNLELAEERLRRRDHPRAHRRRHHPQDVEEGQIIQSASQNISGGTTVFRWRTCPRCRSARSSARRTSARSSRA